MIELGIIAVLMTLYILWEVVTAPFGYEDESGWHEDD